MRNTPSFPGFYFILIHLYKVCGNFAQRKMLEFEPRPAAGAGCNCSTSCATTKATLQWGSISCKWNYWYRMMACYIFQISFY